VISVFGRTVWGELWAIRVSEGQGGHSGTRNRGRGGGPGRKKQGLDRVGRDGESAEFFGKGRATTASGAGDAKEEGWRKKESKKGLQEQPLHQKRSEKKQKMGAMGIEVASIQPTVPSIRNNPQEKGG